jgi:hypothetical protein
MGYDPMMLVMACIYLAIGCAIFLHTAAVAFGKLPGWEMPEPEAGDVRAAVLGGWPIRAAALLVVIAITWPLVVLVGRARR